jgi:hypothetical protein
VTRPPTGHEPIDLALSAVLFVVLAVAVWAGGWLVAAGVTATMAWRVRRRGRTA